MANYPNSGLRGVGIRGVAVRGNTLVAVSVAANAGVANVAVAAYGATSDVAAVPGLGNVVVTANSPASGPTVPAGHANVSVAAYSPSGGITAQPGVANVTVSGLAAVGGVSVSAGVGNVTVAAYQPSTTAGGSTTAFPGVANVSVSAYVAAIPVATGSANVSVSAYGPTITVTAQSGVANVQVAALNAPPPGNIIAHPGVANVTVSALGASVQPAASSPGFGYGTLGYGEDPYGTGQTTAPAAQISSPGVGYGGLTFGAQIYGTNLEELPQTPTPPVPTPVPVYGGTCIFEPPVVRDRAPYLPDSTQAEYNLWRHFENRLRGVNVWQRSDGSFCVDTAANYESAQTHPAAYISDDPIGPDLTANMQGLMDTNINYPWNPIPPQPPFYDSTISEKPGAYVFITNWDQTTDTLVLNPYMVTFWEGGSVNPITQSEALILTAAGYGDCIE